MAEDFQVIIDSLGNTALSWIPEVREVTIYTNAVEGTAVMDVCLFKNDWETRALAVEKLVELRQMFIDDLSLDYRFDDGEGCPEPSGQGVRQFVAA